MLTSWNQQTSIKVWHVAKKKKLTCKQTFHWFPAGFSFLNGETIHLYFYYAIAAVRFHLHPQLFANWKTVYWQLTTRIGNEKCFLRQFFICIMYWHIISTSTIQYISRQCCFLEGLQCVTDHLCVWSSHSCWGIKEEDNAMATKAQDVSVYCS